MDENGASAPPGGCAFSLSGAARVQVRECSRKGVSVFRLVKPAADPIDRNVPSVRLVPPAPNLATGCGHALMNAVEIPAKTTGRHGNIDRERMGRFPLLCRALSFSVHHVEKVADTAASGREKFVTGFRLWELG